MADQFHKAAWQSRGFMSFTIPNGGVLYLGGALATVPTTALSGGKDQTDPTCFLVAGIPQTADKSDFADIVGGQTNGHAIKHAVITLVSAGATAPAGRLMSDGSVPTTTLGAQWLIGDPRIVENRRRDLFNYKAFNRSGGNAIFEVEVFE